jgi:hypothetical protein
MCVLLAASTQIAKIRTAQSTAKATGPQQGTHPMMMLWLALLAEVSERACERPNLEDSEGGSLLTAAMGMQ